MAFSWRLRPTLIQPTSLTTRQAIGQCLIDQSPRVFGRRRHIWTVVTPNAPVVSTGRRWFFGRVVIRIYRDHRSEIRSDPVYKTTFLEYQPLHEFQLAFHQWRTRAGQPPFSHARII